MATMVEQETTDETAEVRDFEITSPIFFAMIEAGLFAPNCRVFLWGGRLYEKMAKTVAHASTSVRIHRALSRRLPDDWLIWPENPVALDARHAPLPDITVVRGTVERYEQGNRHPEAADVGLIVEVAVTSLPKDLGERAEKYARALVPNYWVADVRNRRIVEHTGPQVVEGVGKYVTVIPREIADEIRLVLGGQEIARLPGADLLSGPPPR